jgi:hypothetical protein
MRRRRKSVALFQGLSVNSHHWKIACESWCGFPSTSMLAIAGSCRTPESETVAGISRSLPESEPVAFQQSCWFTATLNERLLLGTAPGEIEWPTSGALSS